MPQRTNRSYFREKTAIINPGGDITPGERLLSGDEPTEETFKRLIEACAFIFEKDDTAKTSEQGLVKITSGTNAKSGVTPADGFTYAAQIKNLPTLAQITQSILDLTNTVLVSVTADNGQADKNAYTTSLSSDFLNWMTGRFNDLDQALVDLAATIPDISGLESDIAAIQLQITAIQSDIAALTNRMDDAEADIDALEATSADHETRIDATENAIAGFGGDPRIVGEYAFMPVNTPPNANYFLCDGAEFNRTTFAVLFALIGTSFGVGNGSTTANLPDFRGRGIRGFNSGNPTDFGLAVAKGNDEIALTALEGSTHDHPIDPVNDSINLADGVGSSLTSVAKGNDVGSDTLLVDDAPTIAPSGGNADNIDIKNPYLTTFVFIKHTV